MKYLSLISFDVGGTLVDHSFIDSVWNVGIPRLYAERKGVSLEEAKEQVAMEYETVGRNDIRWYILQYWFDRFELDSCPSDLLESLKHEVRLYPEVSSVLECLEQFYELAVVSNAPKDILSYEIEGLRHHFKRVFSSVTDFNQIKKTAGMYVKICAALGIKPGKVLHIGDDRCDDFLAPREAGMHALHLDRSKKRREDLTLTDLKELQEYLIETQKP